MREPGVGAFDPLDGSHGYHPQVMPRLTEWIAYLAARLRHVRILHGDWARTCTTGAAHNLPVRQGKGPAGVFLDPPYSAEDRASLYREESFTVANDVRDWCLKHGDNPKFRIVLAGYDTEHPQLVEAGWREVEWYKAGHLTGGYGNIKGAGKHQQKRERLWLSPHCLTVPQEQQQDAA